MEVKILQQNYSQRLEMQIPKENTYQRLGIMKNFDNDFAKLSNNYEIHEIDKVKSFIKKHENILDYIHELTPLINEYFPYNTKFIEFCEDPEFSDLDFIMIYIKSNEFNNDYEILKRLKDEPLYMSKFSRNIRGLLCVELW